MEMSLAAIFIRSGGNGVEISERPMKNRPAFTERFVFFGTIRFHSPTRTCIREDK